MTALILYLLKLSICLGVVYIFYLLVLRRLTFYNWNRFYLAGYALLAFFIPFIDISPIIAKKEWHDEQLVNIIPSIINYEGYEMAVNNTPSLTKWQLLLIIFAAGIFVMLCRLLVQYLSFLNMRRNATLISVGNIGIYQVDRSIIPFSFGNSIFINRNLHEAHEIDDIIRHEFVHVKQKHTIDIILGELICILNWYNPFAWLLRKAIRQNLEFIADQQVLQNGISKKDYQYLLLRSIGDNHFSIANKFNFSSLKKRIAMMNKIRSAKLHLSRFVFLVPLLAVLLLAFRKQQKQSKHYSPSPVNVFQQANPGELMKADKPDIDTVPPAPINSKGYYLDVIGVNGHCTVVVKDRNRKEIERLDLLKWNENKTYENKYGEIPEIVQDAEDCGEKRISKRFEIDNKKATMYLENGKKEVYDLTDPIQKNKFESRYGKIIEINESVGVGKGVGKGEGSGSGEGKGIGRGDVTTVTQGVINSTTNLKAVSGIDGSNVVILPVTSTSSSSSSSTFSNPVRSISSSGSVVDEIVSANGVQYIVDYDIVVTISKKSTKADLDKLIVEMKTKGVDLVFDKIEYNDSGEIRVLSGSMKAKKSKGNFVATDFNKLTLSVNIDGDSIHFKVDVQEKVVS